MVKRGEIGEFGWAWRPVHGQIWRRQDGDFDRAGALVDALRPHAVVSRLEELGRVVARRVLVVHRLPQLRVGLAHAALEALVEDVERAEDHLLGVGELVAQLVHGRRALAQLEAGLLDLHRDPLQSWLHQPLQLGVPAPALGSERANVLELRGGTMVHGQVLERLVERPAHLRHQHLVQLERLGPLDV